MESSCSVACALFLLAVCAQLHGVQSEVVPCFDQQEVCECRDPNECVFTLTIEELQTFTSYEIEDGDELTRGIPGNVYYLNEIGYNPAPTNKDTPETSRKSCVLSQTTIGTRLLYDQDFLQNNCSVPMTVDGATYRMFIAVNGRIPGPTLIVNENALVRVRVENKLTSEGITIHWHGMHQRGTPWMDGVGFISQAPITPGAYFDYVFNATPPGTHWYHSHVGAQRTDGLFGALIVRETSNYVDDIITALRRAGSLPYDEIVDLPANHTLTLLDWQREASLDLFVRIHSALGFFPQKPVGNVPRQNESLYRATIGPDFTEVGPIPYWSGLINGRGRRSESTYSPLSVFPVAANKAYRFRIIGAQSVYAYNFSIDNHRLVVIATDGHFIRPVTVDYIIVHSGERYDFILETFNQIEQNYWIRAETLEVDLGFGVEHSARAVLKYDNDLNATIDWTSRYNSVEAIHRVCNSTSQCQVLNCPFRSYPPDQNKNCISLTSLAPLLRSSPSPSAVSRFNPCDDRNDCTRFFNFGFEGVSVTSAVNGKNFELPVTPYQTYCGRYEEDRGDCENCTESNPVDCRCIHVESIMESEQFDRDRPDDAKTVIMVFSAVGVRELREFAHPIHLHGHSFRVLHVGYGEYNETNALIESSGDVTCNVKCNGTICTGDRLCMNPMWRDGEEPDEVTAAANNLNDRILKDTVIVPAGGYVAVAFPADNPGYWFLHCHIEVHQLEGMGVLIEEYPFEQHRAPPPGINDVGNFRLEISKFQKLPVKTCAQELPVEPVTCAAPVTCAGTATVIVNAVIVLCVLVAVIVIRLLG